MKARDAYVPFLLSKLQNKSDIPELFSDISCQTISLWIMLIIFVVLYFWISCAKKKTTFLQIFKML